MGAATWVNGSNGRPIGAFSLDDGGRKVFTNVTPLLSYAVVEEDPFTNAQPGSITVHNITLPDSTDTFTYTGTGALGSFTVDGGQVKAFPSQPGGSYTITETARSGHKLTSLGCANSANKTFSGSTATGSVTGTLPDGGTLHCVLINAKSWNYYLPVIFKNATP